MGVLMLGGGRGHRLLPGLALLGGWAAADEGGLSEGGGSREGNYYRFRPLPAWRRSQEGNMNHQIRQYMTELDDWQRAPTAPLEQGLQKAVPRRGCVARRQDMQD